MEFTDKDIQVLNKDAETTVTIVTENFTAVGTHGAVTSEEGFPVLANDDSHSELAYAIKRVGGTETRYLVLSTRGGGKLHNPWGEPTSSRYRQRRNDNLPTPHISVSHNCFQQYILYLKTKDVRHLRAAERMI